MKVMPGDTIIAEVSVKYLDPDTANWTSFLHNLIMSIAGGTAPAGTFVDGGSPGSTGGNNPNWAAYFDKEGPSGNAPKAYLNILIFDQDFDAFDGSYVAVTEAARENGSDGPHEKLQKQIVIREPGYVYIFLSNDNVALGGDPVEVYFDDFKVTHIQSKVVQKDDYYPFGLSFNSYRRENATENRYLYKQGSGEKKFNTERVFDLGLNIDLTRYRAYDPAIGRWWQVDPKSDAETLIQWSPYNYSFNNPVRYNDPLGDCPPCDGLLSMLKKAVVNYVEATVKQVAINVATAVVNEAKELSESISVYGKADGQVKIGGAAAFKVKGGGLHVDGSSVELISGKLDVDSKAGMKGSDVNYMLKDGKVNLQSGVEGGVIVEGGYTKEKTFNVSDRKLLQESTETTGGLAS